MNMPYLNMMVSRGVCVPSPSAPLPGGEGSKRRAFTLVELLVVMSLMAILATMMIAFFPSVTTSAREARAASLLQGWLNIAKQRALRDGTPTGVRLILNPALLPARRVIECQYISQPDDFSIGKVDHLPVATNVSASEIGNTVKITTTIPHGLTNGKLVGISGFSGAGVGYNGSFAIFNVLPNSFEYITTVSGLAASSGGTVSLLERVNFDFGAGSTASLTNGYTPVVIPNSSDTNLKFWAIQPGDYLEVNGTGLVHRITQVNSSNQLVVSPPLPNTISQAAVNIKASYRIIRAPRVAGDEILKLPESTFIDIDTNFSFGNTLQLVGNEIDILFAPSGSVISRGVTTEKIHLWVRSPNADFPNDAFRGEPTLISIFVRTGVVGAYQPDPQSAANPYTFVR